VLRTLYRDHLERILLERVWLIGLHEHSLAGARIGRQCKFSFVYIPVKKFQVPCCEAALLGSVTRRLLLL
jgi:hypothetical protein